MTNTLDINLWPSNRFTAAAKDYVAELLPGTPAWALFPRWYTDRRVMVLQSSGGSSLVTLDMDEGTARFSSRLEHLPEICGQTLPVPDSLKALAS